MRFPEMQRLETSRLILRKLTASDTQLYYERLGSSAAVTRYMLFEPHKDISESEASIQKALRRYEKGRCYRWCIAGKEDDALVGVIELLRFDEGDSSCSFAYMLGEDFWGMGYGTEALTAALDFAFRKMEVESVMADHICENGASGAVMRKVGMVPTGVLAAKYLKNGILHDAAGYRVDRSRWFASHP